MWTNVCSRFRSLGVVLVLIAAWLIPSHEAFGGPVIVPLCVKLPNGSFRDGFTHWSVERCVGGYGKYSTFVDANIVDLT
ncbi:MAG: hypothetical protein MI923_25700, partial [Phycisphaerales bacterium]|nr:hypothetical protein [Phycisphaerales bacterium]